MRLCTLCVLSVVRVDRVALWYALLCGVRRQRWVELLRREGHIRNIVASLVDLDLYEGGVLRRGRSTAGVDAPVTLPPSALFHGLDRHKARRLGPFDSRDALGQVRRCPVCRVPCVHSR